jgi:magnesium transporter
MVFYSELRDKDVYDSEGTKVGSLVDMIFVDGERYAHVSHIIYIGDDRYRKKVSFELIKELAIDEHGRKEIRLNKERQVINPQFEDEKDLRVGSLLDKQIIDIDGLKVVRVNDLELAKIDKAFSIVGVCVGGKSFIRRLGLPWLTGLLQKKAKERVIPWGSVEPLDKSLHSIHVKLKRTKIGKLHPSEIADIMEDLSLRERALIFSSLDTGKAAMTLVEANEEVQESFLKDEKTHRILMVLEHMSPDQTADILSMMPKEKAEELIGMMRDEEKHKVREILGYHEESAGGLMRTDYIAIPDDYTAEKVINLIRQTKPESELLYRLYVVDKRHKLLGVLTIKSLILAQPDELVTGFMRHNILKIKVDAPKEEVAKALSMYSLFALPVVDELNTLKGVVTADDVLEELIPKKWQKRRMRFKRTRKTEREASEAQK